LGVYYDVGNATSKGYDIASDIRFVGPLLYGVHIKDRKRGGPSVLLGQGETDFEAFFKALAEIHYTGQLVLQTAFGQDYLTIARSHLAMVRRLTSKYARTAPPFEYQLT
jgi:hexulose-6-phosphate isomerase